MMRSFTLLLLLSSCTTTFAQCTIAVPGNAIPITTLQGTVTANGQFIWVCLGGLAAVTGNGNTVVVEEQGVASLIGDNNTLITKVSSTFVNGSNNAVYILDAAGVADLGTGTMITTCPSILFTYGNAPANGCLNVGIAETATSVRMDLFPNPASRMLNVAVEGARIERVRLFDAQGRVAMDLSGNLNQPLDVAQVPAGLFLVLLDTDQGSFVRSLVKE